MSNVRIPFGDKPGETATLLLAACDDLEMDQGLVRTDSEGNFYAPREVAEEAGVEYESDDDEADEAPAPKKRAAKKTAKKSSK